MGKRVHRDLVIRGVTYPTAQAAARALALSQETVMLAVRLGRLDRLGVGRGRRDPCPVRVRGKLYPSAKAAAGALSLKVSTIRRALSEGREENVGLPHAHLPGNARSVVIGGLRFASMAEASRSLGFACDYVSHVLRRGRPVAQERLIAAAMALQARREREAIRAAAAVVREVA